MMAERLRITSVCDAMWQVLQELGWIVSYPVTGEHFSYVNPVYMVSLVEPTFAPPSSGNLTPSQRDIPSPSAQ